MVAGCSSGPSPKSPEDAKAAKLDAAVAAPKPTPAQAAAAAEAAEVDLFKSTFVTDPDTGQKLQRIVKGTPGHYVERGVLRVAYMNERFTMPVLKEDDAAWYIAAVPEAVNRTPEETEATRERAEKAANRPEIPAAELEEVLPPVSAVRLGLQEISEGLPTAGFWRQNFTIADIDGDGRFEIITPPARLTVGKIRAFQLQKDAWMEIPLAFEMPEGRLFDNGGVTAADFNGDGKVDLVAVAHGPAGGPLVAYNLGGRRFRVEGKGLPRSISSRSVAVGDLDEDGRLDIVTLSDTPQGTLKNSLGANPNAMNVVEEGLVPGYDLRAFLQAADGSFSEYHVGLDTACFGYATQLWAKPPDGGEPFIATDCRYQFGMNLVYGFNRAAKSFHTVGSSFVEDFAFHTGVALGLYKGLPGVFEGYTKSGPPDLPKKLDGAGVSIYYRDGAEWKRKRVIKTLDPMPVLSQGIAVGDLDGDGRDDVVWADTATHRLRIFFQRADGEFEELAAGLEPTFENNSTCLKVADLDGDGKNDIVLMYETGTGLPTRSGGLRFFRNLGTQAK
jgi:hypothetical protein